MASRSHEPKNPYEEEDGVTKLQEDVLGLLEEAGLSQAINDRIVALVRQGEQEKYKREQASAPGI